MLSIFIIYILLGFYCLVSIRCTGEYIYNMVRRYYYIVLHRNHKLCSLSMISCMINMRYRMVCMIVFMLGSMMASILGKLMGLCKIGNWRGMEYIGLSLCWECMMAGRWGRCWRVCRWNSYWLDIAHKYRYLNKKKAYTKYK